MHLVVDRGIRTTCMSRSGPPSSQKVKTYLLENPAAAGRDRGAAAPAPASAAAAAVVVVARPLRDRSFFADDSGDGEVVEGEEKEEEADGGRGSPSLSPCPCSRSCPSLSSSCPASSVVPAGSEG